MRRYSGAVEWIAWFFSLAALVGWLAGAVHRGNGVAIVIVVAGLIVLLVMPLVHPRGRAR